MPRIRVVARSVEQDVRCLSALSSRTNYRADGIRFSLFAGVEIASREVAHLASGDYVASCFKTHHINVTRTKNQGCTWLTRMYNTSEMLTCPCIA